MSSELEQLQAALDAIQARQSETEASGAAVSDPARATADYVVQSNDTLASIAAAQGTTVDALMAANVGTLIDPDSLIIGQAIALP